MLKIKADYNIMKTKNLETGHLGEEIGREFLRKKGYKIIDQNYKTKFGEIDLIVRDKKTLVFVEVRTKIGDDLGSPEDSLNREKIKKLIKNAAVYVSRKDYQKSYRIDAVCIVLEENRTINRATHYQNITF